MIEISAPVRLAMLWKFCHFYNRLVLVEPVIVHDKVQLRVVAVEGLANNLFDEAICHDIPNLLRQEVRGSL